MAQRHIVFRPATQPGDVAQQLTARFEAVRREFEVPDQFPPAVVAEASCSRRGRHPAGAGRDGHPVHHHRPADLDGPRPGHVDRAPWRGVPGALRHRRRAGLRPRGRCRRRRGPPPWPDGLLPRRAHPAAPVRAERGRRQPAPRPGAPGLRLGHHPRRRRRGHRGGGPPGHGAQRPALRLRAGAEGGRRRHRRGVPVAAQGGRGEARDARAPARRRDATDARAGGRGGRERRLPHLVPPAALRRGLERPDLPADRDGGGGPHAQGRGRHPAHDAAAGPP